MARTTVFRRYVVDVEVPESELQTTTYNRQFNLVHAGHNPCGMISFGQGQWADGKQTHTHAEHMDFLDKL